MWEQWKRSMLGFSKQEEEFGQTWQTSVEDGIRIARICINPNCNFPFVCNPLCMLFLVGEITVQHWKVSWRHGCVPPCSAQALFFGCKEQEGRKIGCGWLYPLFARIRILWRALQGWKTLAVLFFMSQHPWNELEYGPAGKLTGEDAGMNSCHPQWLVQ